MWAGMSLFGAVCPVSESQQQQPVELSWRVVPGWHCLYIAMPSSAEMRLSLAVCCAAELKVVAVIQWMSAACWLLTPQARRLIGRRAGGCIFSLLVGRHLLLHQHYALSSVLYSLLAHCCCHARLRKSKHCYSWTCVLISTRQWTAWHCYTRLHYCPIRFNKGQPIVISCSSADAVGLIMYSYIEQGPK